MSLEPRDPRHDPAAGDVLANPRGEHFYVLFVEDGSVYHQQTVGELDITTIEDWRDFSRNDVVVRRGDASGGPAQ